MQTDFHYYATYTLFRLAGYDHPRAQTIAYASQYADDADDGRAISFDDGETFNPTMTSYSALHWGNLTQQVQREVYMAFHFIPGVDPEETGDLGNRLRLETRGGCKLARDLLSEALADSGECRDQRLGLAVHSFADTFAHEGFSGFAGPENDVEDVGFRDLRNGVGRFFRMLWHAVMEAILPAIGHAEVGHLPDEPFRTWGYYDYSRNAAIDNIDNGARFMAASEQIFEAIGGRDWTAHQARFEKLLCFEGNEKERCINWHRAIMSGYFGFQVPPEEEEMFRYSRNRWRDDAMVIPEEEKTRYQRRPGFATSAWVKFHQAARAHRKSLLGSLARLEEKGLRPKPGMLKFVANGLFKVGGKALRIESRKSFSFKWLRRGLFRFVVYGAFLVAGEVSFYTLIKAGRKAPDLINWLFDFQWRVDPALDLAGVWDTPIVTLYGQASLWMFLVYAIIGVFGVEPAFRWMREADWPGWLRGTTAINRGLAVLGAKPFFRNIPTRGCPFWFRGTVYALIILAMECGTGWILFSCTGYKIWYYTDPFTIFVYTSAAIGPFWFLLGLVSENFMNLVIKYSEKKVALRKLTVW